MFMGKIATRCPYLKSLILSVYPFKILPVSHTFTNTFKIYIGKSK